MSKLRNSQGLGAIVGLKADSCVNNLPDRNLGSVCDLRGWNMSKVKGQRSSKIDQLSSARLVLNYIQWEPHSPQPKQPF